MMDNNFTVKPTNLDQTIKNIVSSIDKGYELQNMDEDTITSDKKLDYNDSLILKPFYQRDYRSTVEDESSLIESILVGIPIPPVFLCSTRLKGVQVLNVVDGQHRLFAFYRFRKGKFRLSNLPLLSKFNGMNFDELPFGYQEQFISHKLPAFVFRDFPGKEFELEVFNRYNKGTKALTPQEIRNAVYASPYSEYIGDFVKKIYESDDEQDKKLRNIFNVSRDRLLKKKVHEGIFSILYVLEYGIQGDFKDSTTYATEYMKNKSNFCSNSTEEEISQDLDHIRVLFKNYLNWLLECTKYTPYPISKEFYGISSKQYKFSTSMALMLTALYKKVYIDIGSDNLEFDDVILKMKTCLKNSFLEDSSYSASTTNSREIKKLIENFTI